MTMKTGPCCPWRGTLHPGPKPRWGLFALKWLESNPQLSLTSWMEDWHSSIPAWRIPWTEESGGYSPWHCKKLDTTEWLNWTELTQPTKDDRAYQRNNKNSIHLFSLMKFKAFVSFSNLTNFNRKLETLCTISSCETVLYPLVKAYFFLWIYL